MGKNFIKISRIVSETISASNKFTHGEFLTMIGMIINWYCERNQLDPRKETRLITEIVKIQLEQERA